MKWEYEDVQWRLKHERKLDIVLSQLGPEGVNFRLGWQGIGWEAVPLTDCAGEEWSLPQIALLDLFLMFLQVVVCGKLYLCILWDHFCFLYELRRLRWWKRWRIWWRRVGRKCWWCNFFLRRFSSMNTRARALYLIRQVL